MSAQLASATTTSTDANGSRHATVQSLPCSIEYDGPAAVGARMIVRGEGARALLKFPCAHPDMIISAPFETLGDALESAFRGRKLRGRDAPLPAGVTGCVLDTTDGDASIRGTFDRVRVWGHDAQPTGDHYVLDSFDTIRALSALHEDS